MKYLRHLAFVMAFVLMLAVSGHTDASSLDYQTKTLSNGMKLVYKVLPDSPTVTFRFVVPAGFLTEPKDQRGISHLLEHLIYRGNSTYSKDDFNRRINGQGGSYNGGTWLDWTEYHAEVPSEYFSGTLSMYADMILNPGLSNENIALEKKIVTVEKAIRNLPGNIVWLYFSELTEQRFNYDVTSVTPEDLTRYHQMYYHPNLMTVIVTGSFNPEEVIKTLSMIKDDPKAKAPSKPEWVYNFNPSDVILDDYLQGERYKLLYGFDLKQVSGTDRLVAKVLPWIFSYENRNFDNITNRPLDYDIGLINFYDRYYLVFIYRDCQEDYSDQMSAWHQKNLDRYCKFLKAKNFEKFQTKFSDALKRQFESLDSDALQLNEYYFSALFDPSAITERDLSAIRSLSSGDYKRFVQKYLEGKPYQKIVIKAIQTKDGIK